MPVTRLAFNLLLVAAFIHILFSGFATAKTNGDPRPGSVDMVVLHAIGGPVCKDGQPFFQPIKGTAASWADFFRKDPVLGIHYVIGRDGAVEAMVPEGEIANHALGHNKTSIGIEMVNTGDGIDPFPEAQIAALEKLLKDIRVRHGLKADQIVTHQEIDTRQLPCGIAQKVDPGPAFPFAAVIAGSNP
jgi:hypothetical protein